MKANSKETARLPKRLDAEVAKHVMGWREVHKEGGSKEDEAEVWGKKQDKAGRWRKSKVPDYCSDVSLVAEVEDRLKARGVFDHYTKELSNVARRDSLPEGWASPLQRCQAALNVVKRKGTASARQLKIVPKRK